MDYYSDEVMDLLIVNANIISMDKENIIYQALGIKDGNIKFLGSNEDALLISSKQKLDAKGEDEYQ